MKYVLKEIFRPINNRYHTSKRMSVLLYVLGFLPAVIIALIGAIFVDSIFWAFVIGVILVALIGYIVFDPLKDKLTWQLLWRRFYSDKAELHSTEHQAMKRYEQNPTPENYEALQKLFRKE